MSADGAITRPAIAPGARPRRPSRTWANVALAATVFVVVWSAVGLDIKWARLFDAPVKISRVFSAMARNFQWHLLPDALREMWDSVSIAWLSTMLAALAAVPLGIIAAENVSGKASSLGLRQVFNVLRSVPELVLVLMVLPVLGFTQSAGVLAIAIGSVGTLSKLISEAVEGIDTGPIEAVDAAGASRLQRLRWGVIPQASPDIASFILYRFEINIRVSAILGVLGLGGIGGKLADALTFKRWDEAGIRLVVVVVITMAVDMVSGAVRRRILSGPAGDRSRRDDGNPRPAAVSPTGANPWI